MRIDAYDFDGVVTAGARPKEKDIIITGRIIAEADYAIRYLYERGIFVPVYFAPGTAESRGDFSTDKSRVNAAKWKVAMILGMRNNGVIVERFYEDEDVQYQVMEIALAEHNVETEVVLYASDE